MLQSFVAECLRGKRSTFVESIDVAFNMSFDVKRYSSDLKGSCLLPHGHGKVLKVYVVLPEGEVDDHGSDGVFEDALISSVASGGRVPFDVLLSSPSSVSKISKAAKALGSKGLMPNAKFCTLRKDLLQGVKEFKESRVCFKPDKSGVIHLTVGTAKHSDVELADNLKSVFSMISSMKPADHKGSVFIKSVFLSSTMGKGISVPLESFN